MPDRSAAPARARRDRSEWLSLGAASRLVGVDPDTLRRWADAGRLEVFTTPGGHRRFRRRSLEALTTERGARPSLVGLGATPDRLAAAYRRSYRSVRGTRGDRGSAGQPVPSGTPALPDPHPVPPAAPAVGAPAVDDRDGFRADGRRLLEALVAYLEAAEPDRASSEAVAAECVTRMARRLASEGRSLTESLGWFVLARRPFLAELRRLGEQRRLDAAYLGRLYDEAAALLDRLLLDFVAAFQVAAPEVAAAEVADAAGMSRGRTGRPTEGAPIAAEPGAYVSQEDSC
ncbi:MAG TPA: helix-turn-helix domain-containing protein [Candidatus Binatia bacterium]|nr:helix-turn-helix domain-containing protein [Candidatus Binatia bacterium]